MSKYKLLESYPIDEDMHVKIIRTTASPRWCIQWNAPGHGKGRQRRKSLKTTSLKEARSRAYAFARELAAGANPAHRRNRVTVREVVDRKLARMQALKRAAGSIKAYRRYYAMLMAFLPGGADDPLSNLTTSTLEAFEDKIRTAGVQLPSPADAEQPKHKPRPLAPKTIREAMKAAKGLILFAAKRELIDGDPSKSYELPPGPSAEIEIFSAEELRQIAADPDAIVAPLWQFLVMTCLRIGELIWLLKTDVIVDENGQPSAILIRPKRCPFTGQEWQPKHGVRRNVPLTEEAAVIVTKAMATDGHWLFMAPNSMRVQKGQWAAGSLNDKLKNRLKACGIGHGHLHTFRHTGASFLANVAHMSLPKLQKFLGHADLATTARYLHAQTADVANALKDANFTTLFAAKAPITPVTPPAGAAPCAPSSTTSTAGAAPDQSGPEVIGILGSLPTEVRQAG